ncbi:hypothetical protein [Nonomuraea africana]|uniref:Uncharacterized protein n=1 Tax=Nonomuraea africana TaxID=46171 RepID=A0ABR9KSF7_9ACTN|nr:hypothetical protein [Nonomuraea africana]MBE1564968.1 hypothetical protein [Nonomuraea africana]
MTIAHFAPVAEGLGRSVTMAEATATLTATSATSDIRPTPSSTLCPQLIEEQQGDCHT